MALWVVIFHLHVWTSPAQSDIFILDYGYLGVDFFFMLSGFVLAWSAAKDFLAKPFAAATYTTFLAKRIFRLFPLHIAILLAALLARSAEGHRPDLAAVAVEAALMHRWGDFYVTGDALNLPDWSISTEWAVNLLFPVFLVMTRLRARSPTWSLALIVIGVGVYVYFWTEYPNMNIWDGKSYHPLVRCIVDFCAGIIVFQWRDKFSGIASDAGLFVTLLIIGIGFIARADIVVIIAMAPLLGQIAAGTGKIVWLLERPILYHLGLISYSIYLLQYPVTMAVNKVAAIFPAWANYIHWLGGLGLILLTAELTYRFIETPGRAVGRLVSKDLALKPVS